MRDIYKENNFELSVNQELPPRFSQTNEISHNQTTIGANQLMEKLMLDKFFEN